MFELKPANKWVVIDPVKEDERVGKEGLIIAPGNALQKQHKMARIVAKDDCDEAKNFKVGDMVFYDVIGSVEGRVGNQGFTMVRALNIMAVVAEKTVAVTKFDDILAVTGEKRPEPSPPLLKRLDDETVVATSEKAKERLLELSAESSSSDLFRAKAVGTIEYPGDTIPGVDPNELV
jgi:co-chaperonin GroES (HSP10)